jgi:UDP-3-O-[3-hydroxymyristoyl] glucosamine N-acyltransferase
MKRTAAELAQHLGAKLTGDSDAGLTGVASPERARAEDLIYLESPRHRERAEKSAAVCAIVKPGERIAGKTTVEAVNPKLAFAKAAAWLLHKPSSGATVHPSAIISSSAKIAPSASIGPYVVIEDEVEIGAGTHVAAFCFLGNGARLGQECVLHPRVTLYPSVRIGDRVEIHSGAVIGSDGFGYVSGEGRNWKFPQIGSVEIADDVEIGANATIDRGSLETTSIASGVKIDNLVQIAHNVQIGENSILAAQTGVSGSSTIGKRVLVGGQVGIADHCRLEDDAVAGAQAGIPTGKAIHKGQVVWGTPARPLEKFKEQYAWFARLPELANRLRKLEDSAGWRPKR